MSKEIYIDESVAMNPGSRAMYSIARPNGGWRRRFPVEYADKIRPIAETLSILDGADVFNWKSYLQEADAVFRLRPKQDSEWCWIHRQNLIDSHPATKDLWDKLDATMTLVQENNNGNV